MSYFQVDVTPGRVEMPQVVRYANREFDSYIEVSDLSEPEVQDLRNALDALDDTYVRTSEALRLALEMRDVSFHMPSLFPEDWAA